jgi:hypothetical protein
VKAASAAHAGLPLNAQRTIPTAIVRWNKADTNSVLLQVDAALNTHDANDHAADIDFGTITSAVRCERWLPGRCV